MAAVTIRKEVKENKGDCIVRGCVFDIPSSELSSYFEREHRYIPVEVEITDEKSNSTVASWTVVEHTDIQYKNSMLSDEWYERVGQYYPDPLWSRTDIRPMRKYLSSCVSSSFLLGGKVWLDNFLDSSLADGTSIREYLRLFPERFTELEEILF